MVGRIGVGYPCVVGFGSTTYSERVGSEACTAETASLENYCHVLPDRGVRDRLVWFGPAWKNRVLREKTREFLKVIF